MVVRRVFSLVVVVVLLSALGPADPLSDAPRDTSTRYYLSLGDSLAFGFQPDLFHSGDFAPADYTGYAGDFAAMNPGLTLVNYGCPGETSASMIGTGRFAGCIYPGALHNSYGGSKNQAAAAAAFLDAHPGQVDLISIALGANHHRQVVDTCRRAARTTGCISRALPATLQTLRENYRRLLTQLTDHAPDAQIVLFTYYNPMAMRIRDSDALVAQASDVVRSLADQFDATVADGFAAINGTAGSPQERRAVCKRTWICSTYDDVHPTDRGYRALAEALQSAVVP